MVTTHALLRRLVLLSLAGLLIGLPGCDSQDLDAGPTPYALDLPEAFPTMEIPADNPLTQEGVALGRLLFFDPILSIDSTVACASCHAPAAAFTDSDAFSSGVAGLTGRNSMPIINIGWMKTLFWDGRAGSVEDQALQPVENHVEMGETWAHVEQKLNRHPWYPDLFEGAFQTRQITADLAVKAIAQYERTLISSASRYDRFAAGEAELNEQEALGLALFNSEQADCFHCHGTALFTDNRFHNNGLDAAPADSGLALITGQVHDAGKFKTPTLRNIAYTAPYMHDGRFGTLEEVVAFYNEGVQHAPSLAPLLFRNASRGMGLNVEEQAALVAFLKTLSDPDFIRQEAP